MTSGNPWLDPDATTGPSNEPAPVSGEGIVLQFADAGEFFDKLIRPTYRRRLSAERLWCAEWFLHEEAVARMDGLWRTYEQMRLPEETWTESIPPPTGRLIPGAGEWTGIAAWQRDFLDYHMGVLMAVDGPFQLCINGHQDLPMLPSNPRQPGLFG